MTEKYCEILKTGTFTDSKGNEHTFTTDDLDKISSNFKNVHNRVPICVGHPQTNSPAYGWFNEVKRIGNSLFCNFKGVQDEFKKAVNSGLFKNRSLSLDKDLNIRHLAFLGGQAPAIKGLEDFCFEGDTETDVVLECENKFNFEDEQENKVINNGKDKDLELEELQKKFDEQKAENERLKKEIAEKLQVEKTKEFEDFCSEAIKSGNILPKHKKGVINILSACDTVQNYDFADGEAKTAVDEVKAFIKSLKVMDFKEIAKQSNADAINFEDMDAETIAAEINKTKAEAKNKGIELSTRAAMNKIKNGRTK